MTEQKPEVAPQMPVVGLMAFQGSTTGTHKQQISSSENRTIIAALNTTYGTGTVNVAVSPVMTETNGSANIVLKAAGKPLLTQFFAPNETTALIHVMMNNLGI